MSIDPDDATDEAQHEATLAAILGGELSPADPEAARALSALGLTEDDVARMEEVSAALETRGAVQEAARLMDTRLQRRPALLIPFAAAALLLVLAAARWGGSDPSFDQIEPAAHLGGGRDLAGGAASFSRESGRLRLPGEYPLGTTFHLTISSAGPESSWKKLFEHTTDSPEVTLPPAVGTTLQSDGDYRVDVEIGFVGGEPQRQRRWPLRIQ